MKPIEPDLVGAKTLRGAIAAQWHPRSVYVDALRRHFAKPSPDKGLGSDRYYLSGLSGAKLPP